MRNAFIRDNNKTKMLNFLCIKKEKRGKRIKINDLIMVGEKWY